MISDENAHRGKFENEFVKNLFKNKPEVFYELKQKDKICWEVIIRTFGLNGKKRKKERFVARDLKNELGIEITPKRVHFYKWVGLLLIGYSGEALKRLRNAKSIKRTYQEIEKSWSSKRQKQEQGGVKMVELVVELVEEKAQVDKDEDEEEVVEVEAIQEKQNIQISQFHHELWKYLFEEGMAQPEAEIQGNAVVVKEYIGMVKQFCEDKYPFHKRSNTSYYHRWDDLERKKIVERKKIGSSKFCYCIFDSSCFDVEEMPNTTRMNKWLFSQQEVEKPVISVVVEEPILNAESMRRPVKRLELELDPTKILITSEAKPEFFQQPEYELSISIEEEIFSQNTAWIKRIQAEIAKEDSSILSLEKKLANHNARKALLISLLESRERELELSKKQL